MIRLVVAPEMITLKEEKEMIMPREMKEMIYCWAMTRMVMWAVMELMSYQVDQVTINYFIVNTLNLMEENL